MLTAGRSIPVIKPSVIKSVISLNLFGPINVNTVPAIANKIAIIIKGRYGLQNTISLPIGFLKLLGLSPDPLFPLIGPCDLFILKFLL